MSMTSAQEGEAVEEQRSGVEDEAEEKQRNQEEDKAQVLQRCTQEDEDVGMRRSSQGDNAEEKQRSSEDEELRRCSDEVTKTMPSTSSQGQPKTWRAQDRIIRAKQEGAAETKRQQKAEEGDPMPWTGTSWAEQAAGAAAPLTGSSGDKWRPDAPDGRIWDRTRSRGCCPPDCIIRGQVAAEHHEQEHRPW